MEIVNLLIFVVWVGVVMWLAGDSRIPAFTRKFSGLMIATACLFYGLITAPLWLLALGAYMGFDVAEKIKGKRNEAAQ